MSAELEQLASRLRERPRVPVSIEVVKSFHQRSPRGKREVFSSRKVGRDLVGRSVEATQHGSHLAAVTRFLVWPVLAGLSIHERRHRYGVTVAEAMDDSPVAIEVRSENELEFCVIPEQSRRAKCTVERGKGRVGIRRGPGTRLQIVDGDETTRATRVDDSPVVTPEADRQVAELRISETPAVVQHLLERGSVEISWLG